MRHPLFVLALTVAAGILGCQENAVDPFSETASPAVEKTLPVPIIHPILPTNATSSESEAVAEMLSRIPPQERTILIDALLAGPIGHSLTHITGKIAYTMQEIPIECLFKRFYIGLSVAAQLTPFASQTPVWTVNGQSNDDLYVEVVRFLEKTYALQGSNSGMTLHVRLGVTQTKVYVDNMWLVLKLDQ